MARSALQLPDGTYELRQDDRVKIVSADNLDAEAASFFDDEPEPVPQSVSPANFCIALDQLGLLDEVEAYVATLPRAAQIKWQRATSIDRDSPLITAAAQSENWSVEQVDEVFHLAASM